MKLPLSRGYYDIIHLILGRTTESTTTCKAFSAHAGGIFSRDKIFAIEISPEAQLKSIKSYGENDLENIPLDAEENGFSIVIIPASSSVHLSYAQNSPNYKDIFMKPVIGWISGVDLNDLGKATPKAVDGSTQPVENNRAITMHFSLPPNKVANIGIINLFNTPLQSRAH